MNGGLKSDTLLFIGASIDAKVDPGKRQMMVLSFEPAVAQHIEIIRRSGPEFVEDLPGLGPHCLAVVANDRDLLRAEPLLRQRP